MLLNGGEYGGVRFPRTVRRLRNTPDNNIRENHNRRGIAFRQAGKPIRNKPSPVRRSGFSPFTFGHQGFTGNVRLGPIQKEDLVYVFPFEPRFTLITQ